MTVLQKACKCKGNVVSFLKRRKIKGSVCVFWESERIPPGDGTGVK